MATAPTYQPNVDQYGAPVGPSKTSGCLKGCLIVAVVLFILAIIAGVLIYYNWRGWAASFTTKVTDAMVDESSYPPQEKTEIKAEISRVVEAFRNNQLKEAQVVALLEQLKDSPITSVFIASGIEQHQLARAGLSDDEKSTGRQTIKRFQRGAVDGAIPKPARDSVMVHIADRQPNGPWVPRPAITDEELRAFFTAAKAEADKANVAENPPEIDPSDEVKKVIDTAMKAG